MNLPITTWQQGLWWLLTMIVLGFGWHIGTWLASKITR
jgi:hypothetical protein